MKASDLIKELQRQIIVSGDLVVKYYDEDGMCLDYREIEKVLVRPKHGLHPEPFFELDDDD